MAQYNITITEELCTDYFIKWQDEAFSNYWKNFNQVLLSQSTEQIGPSPMSVRKIDAYRNGFRARQLTTRVGALTLRVPRHRMAISYRTVCPLSA